jgi:hypothetical protein
MSTESENEINQSSAPEKPKESITKKSNGSSTKKPSGTKTPMSRKKKIGIAIGLICLIALLSVGIPYMLQGSRFGLGTSENPTGYYQIAIENDFNLPAADLNFPVLIVNANNSLYASVQLINGTIGSVQNDGNTNESVVFNADQQQYACVIDPGVNPIVVPIECSSDQGTPEMNYINIDPRPDPNEISATIQISPVPQNDSNHYNYTSFTPDYQVQEGFQYTIYLQITYTPLITDNPCVGGMVIFPDYILENYPQFAMTWNLNQTNYACHSIMLNTNAVNWSGSLYSSDQDLVYFTENNINYTMATLPQIVSNGNGQTAYLDMTFSFTATQSQGISFCLWAGCIDDAFSSTYATINYKIGGF